MMLVFLFFALSSAQLIFNNPDFACKPDTKFITQADSVDEIGKPLFFSCDIDETRDHLIPLDLAKGFLDEEVLIATWWKTFFFFSPFFPFFSLALLYFLSSYPFSRARL